MLSLVKLEKTFITLRPVSRFEGVLSRLLDGINFYQTFHESACMG